MHDTLEYLMIDPALRRHHHELLTFGLLYAFTENFMLPLSHDEVVHGKGSLMTRMAGDRRQRFANLRLLYVYMWTYPGKKFLFMGNEIGQEREWDHAGILDWELLAQLEHRGLQRLIHDLNCLYRELPDLHGCEFVQEGFEWLDCHDAAHSVAVYLRRGSETGGVTVVILNFTAVARSGYRVGVPFSGLYREVLNSDARCYAGSGRSMVMFKRFLSRIWDKPCSLLVDLPPLAGLVLVPGWVDQGKLDVRSD